MATNSVKPLLFCKNCSLSAKVLLEVKGIGFTGTTQALEFQTLARKLRQKTNKTKKTKTRVTVYYFLSAVINSGSVYTHWKAGRQNGDICPRHMWGLTYKKKNNNNCYVWTSLYTQHSKMKKRTTWLKAFKKRSCWIQRCHMYGIVTGSLYPYRMVDCVSRCVSHRRRRWKCTVPAIVTSVAEDGLNSNPLIKVPVNR